MEEFNIVFYKTEKGECPLEDFLDSLDKKMRAKMLRMIGLLKQHGNELREPYSKHLETQIFELRAIHGTNITRSLYFFTVDKAIVLTHGFIKKSQKTSKEEIEKAKRYRQDYLTRNGKELS